MTDKKDLPNAGYIIVSKTVSVGVLVTLILWVIGTGAAGIWYASKFDSRLGYVEHRIEGLRGREGERLAERDRLIIVEQQLEAVRQNTERLATVLDRIERRLNATSTGDGSRSD